MLNGVEVTTTRGDLMNLEMEDVSDGLVIQRIDGLDPVKATLVSSAFAAQDGERYQSSRRETRNIKFQLGLRPDPETDTVRSLRKRIYNFFMPKTEIGLKFIVDDGPDLYISGRVETCETTLFSQEPVVDISVICFDPDFYDPNPSLIEDETTSGSDEHFEYYEGDIDTGIIFTLNVNRTLTDFTIYHDPPNDIIRTLDFSAPLASGDVLVISTVSGSKGATLTRSGVTTSVLYAISPQSTWIALEPGDNELRVYAEGAAIPYTIQYTAKYGGL